MSQIRLDPASLRGDLFVLQGPAAHHVVRVLRRKVGDELTLFDGLGNRYQGVLNRVDTESPSAEGRILKTIATSPSAVTLALYQGLPKGSKFDYVIEKATELGVDEIVPFLGEKSVIR